MAEDDSLSFSLDLNTSSASRRLEELEGGANRLGAALTQALKSATVGGKDLDSTLKSLALSLSSIALNAGLQPLQTALSSLAGSLTSSLTSGLTASLASGLGGDLSGVSAFAKGGVPGAITPFATGGIVASPTYFGLSGGRTGLMGEAGAEAILPLKRGADGGLGVALEGGAAAPSIQVVVQTADAASFTRSQAQIAGLLARTVRGGQRNL